VITTEQEEVLGVLDLVREQETDGLERLPAAVDVIAEKEVVLVRWEATEFKQAQEIRVLPVDVAWHSMTHDQTA